MQKLQGSLCRLQIQTIDGEYCKLLVGVGTDGASANIAAAGLKGVLELVFDSPCGKFGNVQPNLSMLGQNGRVSKYSYF